MASKHVQITDMIRKVAQEIDIKQDAKVKWRALQKPWIFYYENSIERMLRNFLKND